MQLLVASISYSNELEEVAADLSDSAQSGPWEDSRENWLYKRIVYILQITPREKPETLDN